MEQELKEKYNSIILAIENAESEIESMVRQKQMDMVEFSEIIKSQAKLSNMEKLIRNILNNFEKYKILKNNINREIVICNTNIFQKKQKDLNKKYRKEK